MGNRNISEIAFDLWTQDKGLLKRLRLVVPEKHEPSLQVWRYADTLIDSQKREVVHSFTHGGVTKVWSFKPWAAGEPDFEPTSEITVHSLRIKAREEWKSAGEKLRDEVASGRVKIAGRAGSPLADLDTIPASAWQFVAITDWTALIGEGVGVGELYDLQEGTHVDPDSPKKRRVSALRQAAETALFESYGKSVPSHLTNDQVRGTIEVYFKANGINREVSIDTAKRAAGRR